MSMEAQAAEEDREAGMQRAAQAPPEDAPQSRAKQRQRVPDFFLIGHQKCGTTALYYMLRDHPQIFLSEYKEPRFFAPELRPALPQETPDRPQALASYLALFAEAAPQQLIGDTSPQYIRSPTAAARIAELRPDARIIAILREPASYLRSYHMQMVDSYVEPEKDFEKAIALEQQRRSAAADGSFLPPQFLYSKHVRYVEQLRRFEASFSREQMLVLIYDDFRADNEATVREVQRFLEVDDTVPITAVQTEPLKPVRSMRLHRLKHALARAESDPGAADLLARTLSTIAPRRVRGGALAGAARRLAYAESRPADEDFMRELRRRYKTEVVALSDYLGRDLVAEWGYSEIS